MALSVSPTESQIIASLRAFLLAALPTVDPPHAWDAVLGQVNRVPEPKTPNYVVMWPLSRPRLSTNIDGYQDRSFTASIAGTTMTVATIEDGLLGPITGAVLFGTGVTAGTTVGDPIATNPDGTGTWNVSPSQTVSLEKMACGQSFAMQPTEVSVQCDVHAATLQVAGDAAVMVATLWRDQFGIDAMAAKNVANGLAGGVTTPLYCADPRQAPFINAEGQYESKWTVDLHMQANQTVYGIPEQFADVLDIEAVSVETIPTS